MLQNKKDHGMKPSPAFAWISWLGSCARTRSRPRRKVNQTRAQLPAYRLYSHSFLNHAKRPGRTTTAPSTNRYESNHQGAVRSVRVDHKFTLYRITTRRMPLKGGSRVPSTADRMCTIAEMGDESLSPSNVFGLHSHQTSAEYSVLKMASQLYTPPRTNPMSHQNTTPSRLST